MSPTEPFKVAAVQDSPVYLDKAATVAKACDLIQKAASEGAKLVVFPEVYIAGYPDWVWTVPASNKALISSLYDELWQNAVSVPDGATDQLCTAAKDNSVYVTIGINERNTEASNASLFNSLLYINAEGQILGTHRKLIPTGGERLMWSRGAGDTMLSFDTPIGKLGGLLCWENFMPLARTVMYQAGVQVYVAATWDSSEAWQTAMRFIAREGGMYVISCAPAMKMDDLPDRFEFKQFYPAGREWINKGNSLIVDPGGKIIVGPVTSEQTILYADIDLGAIRSQKWLFDAAGHYSRPDVFEFRLRQ